MKERMIQRSWYLETVCCKKSVVKLVKELGKNVEVWAFKYSLASTLKEEVDQENIHYLDDNLSKIKM